MIETVNLADITIDGSTQIREKISEAAVVEYSERYRSGLYMDPIKLRRLPDGRLLMGDGHERFQAAMRALLTAIEADVEEGVDDGDALLDGIRGNRSHGVPLVDGDRAKAARLLLLHPRIGAEYSHGWIANECGLSRQRVDQLAEAIEKEIGKLLPAGPKKGLDDKIRQPKKRLESEPERPILFPGSPEGEALRGKPTTQSTEGSDGSRSQEGVGGGAAPALPGDQASGVRGEGRDGSDGDAGLGNVLSADGSATRPEIEGADADDVGGDAQVPAARGVERSTAPLMSSASVVWLTDVEIRDPLLKFAGPHGIGLDPCSHRRSIIPARIKWYGPDAGDVDGLAESWVARLRKAGLPDDALIFVNFPYGEPAWAETAAREARDGAQIIMLGPARPDTQWWITLMKHAQGWLGWEGRATFLEPVEDWAVREKKRVAKRESERREQGLQPTGEKPRSVPPERFPGLVRTDPAPFPTALIYFGKRWSEFKEAFAGKGTFYTVDESPSDGRAIGERAIALQKIVQDRLRRCQGAERPVLVQALCEVMGIAEVKTDAHVRAHGMGQESALLDVARHVAGLLSVEIPTNPTLGTIEHMIARLGKTAIEKAAAEVEMLPLREAEDIEGRQDAEAHGAAHDEPEPSEPTWHIGDAVVIRSGEYAKRRGIICGEAAGDIYVRLDRDRSGRVKACVDIISEDELLVDPNSPLSRAEAIRLLLTEKDCGKWKRRLEAELKKIGPTT